MAKLWSTHFPPPLVFSLFFTCLLASWHSPLPVLHTKMNQCCLKAFKTTKKTNKDEMCTHCPCFFKVMYFWLGPTQMETVQAEQRPTEVVCQQSWWNGHPSYIFFFPVLQPVGLAATRWASNMMEMVILQGQWSHSIFHFSAPAADGMVAVKWWLWEGESQ